jgi:hypothetical protein
MSVKVDIVHTPPMNCQFCYQPRVGIAEGRVYFKCKSVLDTTIKPKWKRSTTCFRLVQIQNDITK